jgi:hypothetical protein
VRSIPDPDPWNRIADPDPALFVSGSQDAETLSFLKQFFCLLLPTKRTFTPVKVTSH